MKMIRNFWSAILVSATFVSASQAQAQFSSPSVDSALGLLGMTTKDMFSDRLWAEDDTFLLPRIREAMLSPTEAYRVGREFAEAVPTGLSEAKKVRAMSAFAGLECSDSMWHEIEANLESGSLLDALACAEQYS